MGGAAANPKLALIQELAKQFTDLYDGTEIPWDNNVPERAWSETEPLRGLEQICGTIANADGTVQFAYGAAVS